ncbi:MAG: glycosyltransferase family 2 protein [Patescibacteria group bacterium]
MRVCIVLPTIDEGPLLTETALAVFNALAAHDVHLLIAASAKLTTPQTRGAIQMLEREYPGKVAAFNQRLPGVGAAIQEAFARAEGDVVVLMTPDLETPPEILPQMIKKLEDGYDMATATRWRMGFAFNGYNPVKMTLNFLFQQIFRAVYLTRLSDLTYGYRAFKIEVIKNIRWEESRHPFFFETMLKPLRLGYKIAEVDAPWKMFITRKSSTGRAKSKDLLAYIRVGLHNRFLPKKLMRVH